MLYGAIGGTGVTMTARETAGREGKGEEGRARTREVKPPVFFTQDDLGEKGYPVRDRDPASYIAAFEPAVFGDMVKAGGIRRGADHARGHLHDLARKLEVPGFPSNRGDLLITVSCNFASPSCYRTPGQFVSLAPAGARVSRPPDAPRPGGAGRGLPVCPAGGAAPYPRAACPPAWHAAAWWGTAAATPPPSGPGPRSGRAALTRRPFPPARSSSAGLRIPGAGCLRS
jgi:hypothetical protein